MDVFPAWAEHLGLKDAVIRGMDFALHDDPQKYRGAVAFIRDDPLSLGALVTTHKLDLFDACKDMFDEVDLHAALMSEISCISKRGGKLIAHAKDPISSGLSIDNFLPPSHFETSKAHLFSMGAGGSTIAISWHLMKAVAPENRPAGMVISNRSQTAAGPYPRHSRRNGVRYSGDLRTCTDATGQRPDIGGPATRQSCYQRDGFGQRRARVAIDRRRQISQARGHMGTELSR